MNTIRGKGMDGDLTRWTIRCLTDRMVEMVNEGNILERHLVEAGIPSGLPVSPILFAIYTSGLLKWIVESVCRGEGLSFVDDVGWVVTGNNYNQVITKLEACTRVSIDCVEGRKLEFATIKTEAALFTHKRGHKNHLCPNPIVKI
jgi:hypothetical protein